LGTTISNIVGFNVTHEINCQVRCIPERCPPSLLIQVSNGLSGPSYVLQSISHSWILKVSSDHGVHVFWLCIGTHCPKSVSLPSPYGLQLTARYHQDCHLETQLLGNGADNWDVAGQCGISAIRSVIISDSSFFLMAVADESIGIVTVST